VGTSSSIAELAGKFTKAAATMQKDRKIAVGAGAFATKKIILAEASRKGVTPTSKIAGKKWGVRYKLAGSVDPSALVAINGPFHLVDNPTKAHQIGPRTKGRRKSGKKAVSFGGIARATVKHPGTQGKGIFPVAKAKARIVVPKIMAESVINSFGRTFK
jgi:hypothetical protein